MRLSRREFLVIFGISLAEFLMGCEENKEIKQKIKNKSRLSSIFYDIRERFSIEHSNDIMKHCIENIKSYSDDAKFIKNIMFKEIEYPFVTIEIELSNDKTSKEILSYYSLMMLSKSKNIKNTKYFNYFKNGSEVKIELKLLGLRYPERINLNNLLNNKNNRITANEWEVLLYILVLLKNNTAYLMSVNDEPFIVITDEELKNHSVTEIKELFNNDKLTIFPTIDAIFSNKDFTEASEESRKKFGEMLNSQPFCEIWAIGTKTKFICTVQGYDCDLEYYNEGPDLEKIKKCENTCFMNWYVRNIPDNLLKTLKEYGINITNEELNEWRKSFTKFIGTLFLVYNDNRVEYMWQIFKRLLEEYVAMQSKTPIKINH